MRVLIASDYATAAGGAERMTRILRDGLREHGHEARVFASTAGLEKGAERPEYSCFGTTSSLRTLLQTTNPLAARSLKAALADFQPDVVHVRMFLTQLSPLILPVLRDVPSLYHAVWYRSVCPTGTKLLPDGERCEEEAGRACLRNACLPVHDWIPLMFQRRLQRKWLDAFDVFVANSGWVKSRLVEGGLEPVTVVPNGVPVREPRAAPGSEPLVLFAGRLVREKGTDVLVRAFARLADDVPDARLVLAGDGPERRRLQTLVAQLGLTRRVEFTGRIGAEELDGLWARTWVQAVPSIWDEPFGIVAAEAMMRGVAVVASHSGGLRDIVRDDETGILVRPGDVQALAGALREILTNRALAERMGAKGHRVARAEFGATVFVERFLGVYRSLIGEAAPR